MPSKETKLLTQKSLILQINALFVSKENPKRPILNKNMLILNPFPLLAPKPSNPVTKA
jgi:hypothetical protein